MRPIFLAINKESFIAEVKARIVLSMFATVAIAVAWPLVWLNSPVWLLIRHIYHIHPTTVGVVGVFVFIPSCVVVLVLAAICMICISGVVVTRDRKGAGTRGVHVQQLKDRVQIALVDIAGLLAMRFEFGAAGARRRLIGEVLQALDFAVNICENRPIEILTDAITVSSARKMMLREEKMKRSWAIVYALLMKPSLMFLRRCTGGRGYGTRYWRLDVQAYVKIRRDPKMLKLADRVTR